MKLELVGWSSRGLRCPDVDIDLMFDNNPARVTLIQMPNGTGKTTTLKLIRAAMNGEASTWTLEDIKSLRRPSETNSEGNFILKLRVDGRPLTFELVFHFYEGKVYYRTTSPGSGGIINGWNPPPNVRRFLDDRFVHLFIFDGEFANDLLDSNLSEASKAIDALFQLYLLEDIKNIAEDDWQKSTKNKPNTPKGLTQKRNKVQKLDQRVRYIENLRDKFVNSLSSLETEINELEQKIQDKAKIDKNLRNDFIAQKEREKDATQQVETSAAKVMNQIRKPHTLHRFFGSSLVELKHQFDRLKLPESTSSQFFEELLEEENCICGRPWDEHSREILEKRAKLYLADEASGFLNSLKHKISVELSQDSNESEKELTTSIEQLVNNLKLKYEASTHRRVLEEELVKQGDEELKEWQQSLQSKKGEKNKIEVQLREINRSYQSYRDDPQNYEIILCLQALKKFQNNAEDELAEITGTIELHKRTRVLNKIINVALHKARVNLRQVITEECNSKLQQVLYRDPIKIEKIERSIKLLNQTNASVGQTLSVGYTFLTTLLSRGQHQFPLVIDSPANPISLEVRREIAKLIPSLCQQFIGFTISSERAGFTDTIYNNCSAGNTKFLTLFRKTSGTSKLIELLPKHGVNQTSNCVLVEGKNYFDTFDIEEDV
ncbi:hypothetical protein ACEYW6_28030 [Nostoc sp. UIC 10607]|uniref:hypothetical protein n=1 Tax=Nostoc sp. UIC 10607 TaxID=3045935 RepID=UPI0039A30035